MSKKKIIKIQSDSEEAKNEENSRQRVSVSEDKKTLESGPGKENQAEVDDPIKNLEAKLLAKEQETKETYDRLLRVSAEFENYKKRASREMEEFRKFSNQSLLKEMLSVVDNLELAMNSTNSHQAVDKGLLQGLEMTHCEILKVFERFKVMPIEAKGHVFDPTYHEAVMQEQTDEFDDNTVINELQKGYLIHDRLLRPSMVVVAKAGEKKEDKKSLKKK
ncbi:MAG: nucleotide exchange factor GrpE [Deltaproteobacteria bacterium]|nr:nucleotide exchange factor GrpE [Deltaproteobacteria bacterium]